MSPGTITLTRLHSADDARPFAARLAALERDAETATWGHGELAHTERQLLAFLSFQRYTIEAVQMATAGGEPVGFSRLICPVSGQQDLAELGVLVVHPRFRRRGIGTALLAGAEQIADELGRTLMVGSTAHRLPPAPGDKALVPPTGAGAINAADAGAQFALAHGYAFEQAERYSLLPLPLPHGLAERAGAQALAAAGAAYRLHVWQGAVPEQWRHDVAMLAGRMSTDAPSGGIDFGQAHWDAHRVAYWHEREVAQGMEQLTAVAEHVPTGRLAGYTTMMRHARQPQFAFQDDTLVAPAHRGHRLGMALKAANLQQVERLWPQVRRIHTWNAEENSHMLAINAALGFAPQGSYAVWRRPAR